MGSASSQVLSAAQMRAAEAALIAAGDTVDSLMQRAGRGAADWVWRVAARRAVTVLCGPGNNGGDGYVIAEALRERGGAVAVVAATEPKTDAARNARALYRGDVLGPDAVPDGEVLVDCLFGTGLARPLSAEHATLLIRLAATHPVRIAIDLPSGVHSDNGLILNDGLPVFDLTVSLGAWKFAHFLMPASATLGRLRLVDSGVDAVAGSAKLLTKPKLAAPAADAHKYRRGLLGMVAGEMPGAAVLAATAAQGGGAGYVRVLGPASGLPSDLVGEAGPLGQALDDGRYAALLVGPGLGRHADARERLVVALASGLPAVLDADALVLLGPGHIGERRAATIATPHEGELASLERAFDCEEGGSKPERAAALARASGMMVVAKGPDTVIAAPDGRMALAPRASSWLSVAGTGDVLAGTVASRLATGVDPFAAACEGVWLHGEAARQAGGPFAASQLAARIASAYAACL